MFQAVSSDSSLGSLFFFTHTHAKHTEKKNCICKIHRRGYDDDVQLVILCCLHSKHNLLMQAPHSKALNTGTNAGIQLLKGGI
jgi:hypothetical protein